MGICDGAGADGGDDPAAGVDSENHVPQGVEKVVRGKLFIVTLVEDCYTLEQKTQYCKLGDWNVTGQRNGFAHNRRKFYG